MLLLLSQTITPAAGVNPGTVMCVNNRCILPLLPNESMGSLCKFVLREATKNPAANVNIVGNTCIPFLAGTLFVLVGLFLAGMKMLPVHTSS